MGPLAGIKVIEIAGLGPAPVAGMMLADMGAEVILIERATADGSAADTVSCGAEKNPLRLISKTLALSVWC